jgi:hypothetical protein
MTMREYHKIPTLFERDPATKFRTLLRGKFATPELEYLQHDRWIFTEKVDGTNIRVMWHPEAGLKFGGRTNNAQIPAHLINRLNEIFLHQSGTFETVFDGPTCLYGEGYGSNIQKVGGNYSNTQEFVLFDVKVGDWWLKWADVCDVAKQLELRCVPVLGSGSLWDMVDIVKAGVISEWGNFPAEGLVARPTVFLSDRSGNRIITKLKARDFCEMPKERQSHGTKKEG